jgi:hypothetical protein
MDESAYAAVRCFMTAKLPRLCEHKNPRLDELPGGPGADPMGPAVHPIAGAGGVGGGAGGGAGSDVIRLDWFGRIGDCRPATAVNAN